VKDPKSIYLANVNARAVRTAQGVAKISPTTPLMEFDGTMQPRLHVSLVASYSSKFHPGML
jgi:hypothetical protein